MLIVEATIDEPHLLWHQ